MRLKRLLDKKERIVAGVMTGTSIDGVDAVIARISGTGKKMKIGILAHAHEPYDPEVRKSILDNSGPSGASAEEISQLNAALPLFFGSAIRRAASDANLSLEKLDLVGSHGQTIQHVPNVGTVGVVKVRSTLQIGDSSVLANFLGVPVVSDFRAADMALGGQGAPLAPYFDYVRFSHKKESRGLLNLGGIANVTLLPPRCARDEVVAFDTGPANMVVDGLAQRLFGIPYDEDGTIAGKEKPVKKVLDSLLEDAYYSQRPPKSTGRESFGDAFLDKVCREFEKGLGPEDRWSDKGKAQVLATATALTAESVKLGISAITDLKSIDRVIVSGGGTQNKTMMSMLAKSLKPVKVERIDQHGIGSFMKEALCFAVLAHELVNGVATGMPSVTGASKPAMQGKICLPS